MKKVLTLVAILFSVVVMAQETTSFNTANSSKEKGVFEFTMADKITEKDVNDAKTYYTKYFTVAQSGQKVTIKMVSNTPENRRIIVRFLSVLRQNKFVVGSKTIDQKELMSTYIL